MELRKFIATTIREYLNENVEDNSDILYHATNSTWTKPEMSGLGFHAGTLKAAKDRIVREKATAENYEKEHKNSEELMYIEKLAQLIISQTAEEKTKKLAETILKESKKSRGDTNE